MHSVLKEIYVTVRVDKDTHHPQSSHGLLTLTQSASDVKYDLITY